MQARTAFGAFDPGIILSSCVAAKHRKKLFQCLKCLIKLFLCRILTEGKTKRSLNKLFIQPNFNCNCVAFDDCILDLDRWERLVPTPTILVTTHLRASFSRGERTDCPEFKRFLADVTLGNPVLQERIWQAVGYLLVPDQHGKAIILLQGRKHSGKSVLVNVVKRCFDDELVVALSVNEFDRRFATSSLYGKKLCVDADLSDERLDRTAVSVLKKS